VAIPALKGTTASRIVAAVPSRAARTEEAKTEETDMKYDMIVLHMRKT
jgi:hypothetical protein